MKRVPEADIPGQRLPRDVNMRDVYNTAQKNTQSRFPANNVPGKNSLGGDARQGAFRAAIGEVQAATPKTLEAILTQVNRKVD